MMILNRVILIAFVFVAFAIACDDIVDKNIAKELLVLRSPSDNFSDTVSVGQTFWWDKLDGATTYNLLIVSPEFDSANSIILDTVITKNQFSMALAKGEYDWCVRGINGGYETEYNCRHIVVKKDFAGEKDISTNAIALNTPGDDDTLSINEIQTLKWTKLDGATSYQVLVDYWDSSSEKIVFAFDSVTRDNKIVVGLSKKRRYDWCVKGINAKYQTQYSCRSILIYN